ncbi:MAG: glutamate racemase [Microgenomates group bacterium]|nr:glutamate racemase [Microgenomates group bacterium]
MKNQPIGVFDSGIGGLTVVKEIIKTLPNEGIVYLGDTARVPYGTRDKKTITEFAVEMTNFLLKQRIKILVVACHTVSAVCLDKIRKISPVPVIGVVRPTVKYLTGNKKIKRIGVIGTRATINSRIYEKEFRKVNKELVIINKACPLFVPLVEEELINHPASKLIAKDYLKIFNNKKIDVLILGCTHYPFLKKTIQTVIGKKIELVDSAKPLAKELKKILMKRNLLTTKRIKTYQFFVTDSPDKIHRLVNCFFNNHFPGKIKKISIK